MIAAMAIDRRAAPLTVLRNAAPTYNDKGDLVPGVVTTLVIKAVVQPVTGSVLRNLPEELRTEARWLVWSRSELFLEDRFVINNAQHKAVFLWDRSMDGVFFRAVAGQLVPVEKQHVW